MIFYLVRHGQTDLNTQKRFQGQMNTPMNEVGIQQINDLADKMVKEGINFDMLIASPLDRAKMSAEIIAEKTGFPGDIIIDPDFIERSWGTLEGVAWQPGLDLDDPQYKMETIPELYDRAQKALGKYAFSPDEKILIVSHGAMLTALKAVLSDFKFDFHDRTVPIIQGNILCCVKEEGKEAAFFNLF
ncbi:MAG: histidine phosphatase family protein [Lachnospiraceae bacterium]|nr:histidine phosphatase family protein [Lachnospiraceae bacterium]